MVWSESFATKNDLETEDNMDKEHWRRETVQAEKPGRIHCKKLELDGNINSKTEMEEIQEILRRNMRMI